MSARHVKWPIRLLSFFLVILFVSSCNEAGEAKKVEERKLPYIGMHDVELIKEAGGEFRTDSIYYTIPKFSFVNQDSVEVSHHNYLGKISVVDFFFSHCPSICPMLSAQMVRVQERVKKDGLSSAVMFLSHTVDPDRDSPARLKEMIQSIDFKKPLENMKPDEKLQDLRRAVDHLDDQLLDILQERFAVIDQIGAHKREHHLTVFQSDRWKDVMESRTVKGVAKNLSEKFMKELLYCIHEESVKRQEKQLREAEPIKK